MPARRAAPSSSPPPRPARRPAKGPTREALLAALAERERDLAEALQFQTATSEVLKVISRSPNSLQPVLDVIVETSRQLCATETSTVWMLLDGKYRLTAATMSAERLSYHEYLRAHPLTPDQRGSSTARAAREKRTVHIPDILQDPEFGEGPMGSGERRALLSVPLMRDGTAVGVITLLRSHEQPFTARQIEAVETFADQAVIAIHNARLFNETQEALERQTATAEILKVISQSPTDARPVFDRIVLTAARVLRCDMALVTFREGDTYAPKAGATAAGLVTGLPAERFPIDPSANFPSRAYLSKTMLHLPDWSLIELPEHERRRQETFGINSALYLPLLREDECIGLLTLAGKRANMFGPSEIAQAESFRDQALIAIENARLFNETKEALERQTATSDILKVIAASPSDTAPVFEAIAHSANRLLGGFSTAVFRFDGEIAHLAAFTPTNPEADAALRAASPIPIMEFPLAAPLIEGEIAQIPDTEDGPQPLRDLARLRGYRAMLFVPLMQQRSAVGFVSVTRKEPGPFDSDDVTLLKTFADQAAIAIENARLFNETQEALEQQKASGEVLSVISNSVSDAAPVFDRILDGCERLVTFDRAAIFLVDADGLVSHAATHDRNTAVLPGALVSLFPQPVARTPMHRAFQEERVVIFRDIANDPEAPWTLREAVKHLGNFSVVVAPMLWERRGIGAIHLSRAGNASFTEKEVALLKTFADQAVIAIQNARMFRETQEALQQQTATAEVLKVISRSTFDLQAVFDTLVVFGGRTDRRSRRRDRHPRGRSAALQGQRELRTGPARQHCRTPHHTGSIERGRASRPVGPDRIYRRRRRRSRVPARRERRVRQELPRRSSGPRRPGRGRADHHLGASPRLHAAPHRTRANLRRPGGDRDRERALVRRGAGAHARPDRGAAIADRDRRGAEGHQPFGVRSKSRSCRPSPVRARSVQRAGRQYPS